MKKEIEMKAASYEAPVCQEYVIIPEKVIAGSDPEGTGGEGDWGKY